MKQRGFTLVELLAAIGIAAIGPVFLAGAARVQGTNAVFQVGNADMQQNVRSALDLFRREVRMAGFGMSAVPTATLAPITVPAPAAGDLYNVNLFGNYNAVRSRVNVDIAAAQTTIPLQKYDATHCLQQPSGVSQKVFTIGQRIAIESSLLGVAEVRTITGFNGATATCTVTVSPALTNAYQAGDPINEIQQVTYRLDGNQVLWRQGVVMADRISNLQMRYILLDGTQVTDPAASLPSLRSASILLHSQEPIHQGMQPEAELGTEVRIRNLAIVRYPNLDNL
jgi:prepilin-type N-terminal cleavage/methylation domain-containing protein